MPKIVDHAQRRRELASAVWQVVRERGVQGASLRAVARQAGWSPSSVQHYFTSQGELLDFAMEVVFDLVEQRLAHYEPPADPRAAASALLEQILPVDTPSLTANEVWVAFLARALVDPAARRLNAEGSRRIEQLCRTVVGLLAEAGQLAPRTDTELETARLHALFDGIALHAVTDPERMPPARMRQIVERHLDGLGGPLPAPGQGASGRP